MAVIVRRQVLKAIGAGGLIGMSANSPQLGAAKASAPKSGKDSSPGFMAILIYTPRPDAEARGYTKWLQQNAKSHTKMYAYLTGDRLWGSMVQMRSGSR